MFKYLTVDYIKRKKNTLRMLLQLLIGINQNSLWSSWPQCWWNQYERSSNPNGFFIETLYILRSKAIEMTKLSIIFLLQMKNKENECPAMIILFRKKKLMIWQINRCIWLQFVTKIIFFVNSFGDITFLAIWHMKKKIPQDSMKLRHCSLENVSKAPRLT